MCSVFQSSTFMSNSPLIFSSSRSICTASSGCSRPQSAPFFTHSVIFSAMMGFSVRNLLFMATTQQGSWVKSSSIRERIMRRVPS